MDLLPVWIEKTRITYPTIQNSHGMIGSVLDMKNAEYIVKAANEYPVLEKRVKELEEENKRLREAAINE